MKSKLLRAFPAFKYRNYQLYFGGQLVSLCGTWMQQVAQGWLVWELTASALWVGIIMALSTLPVLLLGLFAGVIVDRTETKKILIITNALELLLAILLGVLTVTGIVTILHVAIISFVFGVVTALDTPARQALANELVDKKDLSSAIALNAANFNGARIIGPMLAAVAIALIGKGGVFLLNAVSFVPIMIALYFIHGAPVAKKIHEHPLKEIKEGLWYAFSQPTLRSLLLFAGILAIFGWTYMTIMPVFAGSIFNTGPTGLGVLYSSAGLGAVSGAVYLSALRKRFSQTTFILIGNLVFATGLFLFSITSNFAVASLLLFAVGFGLLTQFATMNNIIQHLAPDHLRGRILSIYTIMFMGLSPIGSFQVGWFAEHYSPGVALAVDAIAALGFGILLFFQRETIQRAFNEHLAKTK